MTLWTYVLIGTSVWVIVA